MQQVESHLLQPLLLGRAVRVHPLAVILGIATGIVVGGVIPSQDFDELRAAGADDIYPPGTVIAEAAIELREIDRLFVNGQSQAQTVFEIMGVKGGLTAQQDVLRSRYAEGLAAYRARRFDDARAGFNAALAAVPGDGPSLALLKRIEGMQGNPPPSDWDGAWPVVGR